MKPDGQTASPVEFRLYLAQVDLLHSVTLLGVPARQRPASRIVPVTSVGESREERTVVSFGPHQPDWCRQFEQLSLRRIPGRPWRHRRGTVLEIGRAHV